MSGEPAHGTVASWDDEAGWGVLVSPEVPGEVFAHFSAVRTAEPGLFASLDPGETVIFTWEEAEQDGYAYRALEAHRPGEPPGPAPASDGAPMFDVHIEWDRD